MSVRIAVLVLAFGIGLPIEAPAEPEPATASYAVAETLLCSFDTSPSSKELNRSKVFSRVGGHLAWIEFAEKGGLKVVLDGQSGPRHDDVALGSLTFSADGEHFAYLAREDKKWFAIVDEVAGNPFEADEVGTVEFSSDLRRVACSIRRERLWHVLVDGNLSPGHKHVLSRLFFSPDGRRFAWVASDDGPRQLYLDGARQTHWGNAAYVHFSHDGARVASTNWEDRERQWRYIVDGVPGPIYSETYTDFAFSRDGRRFAYSAHTGKKTWVVVDGTQGAELEEYADVCFSPEGQVAFAARHGTKEAVFVDGEAGPDYEEIKRGSLTFSDSGGHLAYQVRTGKKWQWVVDGTPGQLYDELITMRLAFSPEGRTAFAVQEGGACFLVIDGQRAAKTYGKILTSPTFRSDGSLVYLAWRGAYFRVRHDPVPRGQ